MTRSPKLGLEDRQICFARTSCTDALAPLAKRIEQNGSTDQPEFHPGELYEEPVAATRGGSCITCERGVSMLASKRTLPVMIRVRVVKGQRAGVISNC